MKRLGTWQKHVRRGLTTVVALSCMLVSVTGARAASEPNVYALTTSNQLVQFNESRPDRILSQKAITGLASGEVLLGIDVRPANGMLYGVSSASRLYVIDPASSVATASGAQLIPMLSYDNEIGVDFNPVVDRLRIVTDNGQNLRVNVDTGAVADSDLNTAGVQPDAPLAFAAGDKNSGKPNVVAAAYANNFAGTTTTVLYDIDSDRDILVIQNPPNAGTLNTVGSLRVNASDVVGFDIFTDEDGNNARAVIQAGNGKSTFYTIDLSSGRAQMKSKGTIGTNALIRDIAIAKM